MVYVISTLVQVIEVFYTKENYIVIWMIYKWEGNIIQPVLIQVISISL